MATDARDAPREDDAFFRLAFERAPVGMALVDPEFRMTRVNEALASMLGHAAEDLVGRSFVDFTHPDDVDEDVVLASKLFSGEIADYELDKRFVTATGETIHVHLVGSVVRDESGAPRCAVGIVEDVTERRRAEEERRLYAERTENARRLESLGVLAGGIAHDFNNLLVGIVGEVDLLLDDAGVPPSVCAPLERVQEAAVRASELCRQMLASGGRVRAEIVPVDLDEFVKQCRRLLESSFSERRRLVVVPSAEPVVADTDPVFLRRVLSNLVTNARHASRDGGSVTIRVARRPRRILHDEGPWLGGVPSGPEVGVLEVADEGVGMDEETLRRMFEPFFSTQGAGHGMGLASSLGLVRGLGGAIRVESAPGAGTRVQIALPLASQTRAEPPRESVSASESVLVVDDEPFVRRVLGAMLERLGFQPVLASSGEEALRDLSGRSVRAVLLDVEMPGLAGEGLLRAIGDAAPGVPVVVLSGYDEGRALGRFGGVPVAGFVQKPFTRAALRDALQHAIEC